MDRYFVYVFHRLLVTVVKTDTGWEVGTVVKFPTNQRAVLRALEGNNLGMNIVILAP